MRVFLFLLRRAPQSCLEVQGDGVNRGDVREVATQHLHVIHVAKSCLSDVCQLETSEAGLQFHQEWLQVDDEEEGRQWIPLSDGEENGHEG